jgi:hypothetical protein
MPYWVKFKDNEHPAGCVADRTCIHSPEDAMAKAKQVTGNEPISASILPYGGYPIIWAPKEEQHGFFCMHPNECCDRGSCPRNYACSE